MATYDMTAEITEIIAAGYTDEQITAATGHTVYRTRSGQLGDQDVFGRGDQRAVLQLLDKVRAAAKPAAAQPRMDRQATRVAGFLGTPAPRNTGRCHYCGLPLGRNGRCDECI